VLVDADLRGLVVGMTLATTAPELYRTLLEATAFGTRVIVEAFESAGVPVEQIIACGGLPDRNRLLMQIYADVAGREFTVAASSQTPALGASMFGAVAAGAERGGYDSIVEAAGRMARLRPESYRPDPAHSAVYDRLYAEYVRMQDLFGRGGNDVMRTLKQIQRESDETRAL
jgi:L-ribulokinase